MGNLVSLVFKTMYYAALWYNYIRSFFCDVSPSLRFNFNLSVYHIKSFLKVRVCMWAWATTRRYQHIDGSKSIACLFPGNQDTVGITHHRYDLSFLPTY